jgi:small ligand-binding sensory domain FIST
LFRRYVPVPLTGFFCNGEIGPVGSSTFLHGFTAVFGIFRQP